MNRFFSHLVLMRPANLVTAVADILLGFAASGLGALLVQSGPTEALLRPLGLLVAATLGLYGGGVVFNDVCDAELDRVERPERPIPSGAASRLSAGLLAAGLLLGGIAAAFQASRVSGLIAVGVAGLAVFYDAAGKHHPLLGPLNMGACRGGNLLLGLSAVPAALGTYWLLALIPVAYIAAITTISRGEVHGGDKPLLLASLGLYAAVVGSILALALGGQAGVPLWQVLPFLALFSALIFPSLLRAIGSLKPLDIRRAVKAGVMALILLDATVAASFAGWWYGLLLLLLFPLARLLARAFAVT